MSTRSTVSRAIRVVMASARRCISSVVVLGRRLRMLPKRRLRISRVNLSPSMQSARRARALPSRPIAICSRLWRRRSAMRRLLISSEQLRLLRQIWSLRAQWIDLSAVMWALVRPRWQSVRHLRRRWMESRWRFLCRQLSLHCSTTAHLWSDCAICL